MLIAKCILPLASLLSTGAFVLPQAQMGSQPTCRTLLSCAATNWYEIFAKEESDEKARHINPTDMYYNRLNCQRSLERYRALSSRHCTEVWASVANEDRPYVWYVGRVACGGSLPLEECVARQWNLIQQHGLTIRALRATQRNEAPPAMECQSLDLWCPRPPFDSQCDRLDIRIAIRHAGVLAKMTPDVPNSKTIRNFSVGFEGHADTNYDKRRLDEDGRLTRYQ
jgi:hypothetical protein